MLLSCRDPSDKKHSLCTMHTETRKIWTDTTYFVLNIAILHYDLVPQGFRFQSMDPDSSARGVISISQNIFNNLYQSLTLSACARVTVVVLGVCLSVNSPTATYMYLICESQAQRYKILYGISNAHIVWISLKTLCSPVLATLALDCYLPPQIYPSTHPCSFLMDRINNSRLLSRYKIVPAITPVKLLPACQQSAK